MPRMSAKQVKTLSSERADVEDGEVRHDAKDRTEEADDGAAGDMLRLDGGDEAR